MSKADSVGGLQIRRPDAIDGPVRRMLEDTNVCTVCTLALDGTIHAQPVWVDTDGEHVLLNSVGGRAWVRNLDRDDRVTCTVVNLRNPYEFVEIRGRAGKPTRAGADAHIDSLARKYLGVDAYPWHDPNTPRILFRVRAERIVHMMPDGAELEA
jgi:PPOX class probable F420-dependent enzyme